MGHGAYIGVPRLTRVVRNNPIVRAVFRRFGAGMSSATHLPKAH